jgi:peptide/nickel transport system substrate-binding protein
MRRTSRRLAVVLAAVAVAIGLAACSGSSGSSSIGSGSGSNATGQKVAGGTVTIGWQNGQNPNLIFPLQPATNPDGYNENLTMLMWPYLVYSGDGSQSEVNPKESLFSSIDWSNGNTTATITLKSWKWSDGQPITSRDFSFVYNLIKANASDWIDYTPGLFPDDVKSVQTPSASTIVLNLTRSYNPDFYEDDVLSQIPLLPQHAWDKTSASGKVGDYDQTTAGAKAVWNFLQKEGSDVATFTTNPLWKVVDGPFTLSSFTNDGNDYTYVPNKNYSGTVPAESKVVNETFTTDTAELNTLRSGGSLTTGLLPQNDLKQASILKTEGYSIVNQPIPGEAGIIPNLYNAQVGPVLQQLYVRQAMEDLIDRPQIVSKIYQGYADPGNGPIPLALTQWASSQDKSGGPYPYDPSKAASLLKAHGWKVTPNGVTTCQSPGTAASECGTGITKGEQLAFQMVYPSGTTTTDEEMAAIQSTEEQEGIKITLKAEPFNTMESTLGTCTASSHPASGCAWQLQGGEWEPYSLYPAGESTFATGSVNNYGGYSSSEEDTLIDETEYGSSTQAFDQYENYTAEQLPQLWTPNQSQIDVYKSDLGGFAPLNPFTGSINPEDWYFTK